MFDHIMKEPNSRQPTFVENLLLGCLAEDTPKLIPGVFLTIGLVVGAIIFANWANEALAQKGLVSYILIAIIFGMLVRNTVGLATPFLPGIRFSLQKLLKLGIILLGIRLSLTDVVVIGGWGIPIVIGCILTGLLATTYFTRLLKLPDRLGTLTAVGTSICGATAIVAMAPSIEATDDEIAYSVANITIFGIIAMLTYPYLANVIFGGDLIRVGLFIGTSIHETAQVAGAGLIYDQSFSITADPGAADVAVVTKLVRNVMMAAVVPGMAFLYARRMVKLGRLADQQKKVTALRLVPVFIVGFLLMATLRSIGDAGLEAGELAAGIWKREQWDSLVGGIEEWSGYILATAMAGVGLGTSFKIMKGLGVRPFAVGFVAAIMVGLTSIVLVFLLSPLIEL
ncbi:MAG: putative sulfate exporter family transporter [Chloroflexi bacterium]|nr:putative sulfate exporter family transporter [Chloroflexota bacterium]